MANSNSSVAAEAGAIPVSADPHHGLDHSHAHAGHAHADHDHAAHAPATREIAMPRSYKRSMFLASALERLVIAVLLSGLIWLGISWAVS